MDVSGDTSRLLLRRSVQPGSDVLLVRSADGADETWGLPAGARNPKETAIRAAQRWASEQISVDPALVRVEASWIADLSTCAGATVLATAPGDLRGAETEDVRWVSPDEVGQLRLNPDLAARWPQPGTVGPAPVLIVDGANVVGSRPDGWWRDRAGAAVRLRDQLATAGERGLELAALHPSAPTGLMGLRTHPDIVLVTEGAARSVPSVPGVEVVAAPGSGDDQIVVLAAERSRGPRPVVAVTADRELRRRLAEHDVTAIGPGTLLRLSSPAPG